MNNIINEIEKIKSQKKKKQIGEGILQKLIKNLPFEMHIPWYNYCGPGTNVEKRLKRGDKGINRVDEICKKHDTNYHNANSDEDIKEADNKMLNELNNIENLTIGEKIGRFISEKGIKTKRLLGSGNNPASQSYCLSCKTHTGSYNNEEFITSKWRKMIKSKCKICNRGKSKFVKDFLEVDQIAKVKLKRKIRKIILWS